MIENVYLPPSLGVPDPLAKISDSEPNIRALMEEYQFAWNQDPDVLSRLAYAEDIRYTRWSGQSRDGLKHQELMPEGRYALPYDRAPDTRINLADGIIMQQVDVDYAAFWNAKVEIAPTAASRMSAAQSSEWRKLIEWMMRGPLLTRLIDDVEFASQVLHTIGWVALHPCWRRREALRLQRISLEQIAELAAKNPNTVLAAAPEMIMNPSDEMTEAAINLLTLIFPNLKKQRAEKVLTDLRKDGEAEFPAPQIIMNGPELNVLVPWQDFVLPIEATAKPYEARAVFRRIFDVEANIRERAREEQWNKDFLENVIKTKGHSMEDGTSEEHDFDENMQFIELVYGYTRGVDSDDVPGIYCTTFSPHIGGPRINAPRSSYGQHWLIDSPHGQYPFIFLTTEVTGHRPADARGTPVIVHTQQNEMKQQRDATYVYSQLSVTPPLQKKGTQASRLPPELGPLGIINNAAGGEWSWFPPPPGKPEIAFQLTETVRREVEDYFAIPRADLPPMRWQPRQQRPVSRWLAKWGEAFWQLSCLAYQHLDDQELETILGVPPLLNAEILSQHQLMLWFDVRAMDPEWVESLLKNLNTAVVPLDVAGVMDRAKLIQFIMNYIDPRLAQDLVSDQAGANNKMIKDVRGEVESMMQGNEPILVENDPTAKSKLQFTQQIIQRNPEYVAQLHQGSPGFNQRKAELVEKWLKNLQMSAVQQDNKMVGRLGVNPGQAPVQANGAAGRNGGY